MKTPPKQAKKGRESTFERDLRKACALNAGLQVRDYYGVHIADDMRESHLALFKEFVNAEVGDHVMLVSFKWKSEKHRKKAEEQTKKLFSRFLKLTK